MALFVTLDPYPRGEEDDAALGPTIAMIPQERERYENLGKAAALAIRQSYYDQGHSLYDYALMINNPYHPYFDPFPLPCMMEGWKWPIPDRPFRDRLKRNQVQLADVIASSFETYAVSQKLIDQIEMVEPRVHQYLPYELIQHNGSVHPDRRWLLNICARAETINYHRSDVMPVRDHPHWMMDRTNERSLVLRKEAVAGRALWFEYRYRSRPGIGGGFLVSDRLWEAYNAAGCTVWRPIHGDAGKHIVEV